MKFTKIAAAVLALIMPAGCTAQGTPGNPSQNQNQQAAAERIDDSCGKTGDDFDKGDRAVGGSNYDELDFKQEGRNIMD